MFLRLPWPPLLVSATVVLSAGWAVQPVRDAGTLGDVAEAFLVRPIGYVALAPLSGVLDMLTLLSVRQHIAFVLGALVCFVVWRGLRAWLAHRGWRRHAVSAAVFIGALVVTYAAVAALPRPMARLEAADAHILRIDFHSHTSASHDGRSGWTAERNREWHHDAGYDVAYVTDHATVAAAEQGMAANPAIASEGVTLLQGIEATWTGEHVVILGAERMYKGLLTQNKRDVDEQAVRLASLLPGREPVLVWNHPRDLTRLPVAENPGTPGVRAIEVVNGAPDGMDAVRPKRARIVALAESRNIAMTVGSDNHGWGRATPGWTLMRILGWRAMPPDSLGSSIEGVFREGGQRSTRAIERRVADPGGSSLALAMTVVAAPARMLTTISNDERVAWLIWIWAVYGLIRWGPPGWRRRSS